MMELLPAAAGILLFWGGWSLLLRRFFVPRADEGLSTLLLGLFSGLLLVPFLLYLGGVFFHLRSNETSVLALAGIILVFSFFRRK
jgi:hypothetical protein